MNISSRRPIARNHPALPGGGSTTWPGSQPLGTSPDMSAVVELTLLLRRRREIPEDLIAGTGVVSRRELEDRYGADPADLALVRQVMERLGLDVVSADAAARRVVVAGALSALADVFGAEVSLFEGVDPYREGRVQYRHQHGDLYLPARLDGVVGSVFGLDTQPHARPEFRSLAGQPRLVYTPPELCKVYGFPARTSGAGQTLAIISMGGGHRQQDMDAYFAQLDE